MKFLYAASYGKLIVETYKEDRALKATVQNGFAMVSQKVNLKGLRLLVDAKLPLGNTKVEIPAGCLVFIKESSLQSQPWAKVSLSAEGIEGEFMIIDPVYVEFIGNEE